MNAVTAFIVYVTDYEVLCVGGEGTKEMMSVSSTVSSSPIPHKGEIIL
jgi:hypothetical protein